MPLHHVPVESTVDPHRALEIDELARPQSTNDTALERLPHDVEVQVPTIGFA
jgi:hypothetical protein